jgi:hypothetical protein
MQPPRRAASERVFEFSRFRWAHIPLAIAAFYAFAFVVGLLMVGMQSLILRTHPSTTRTFVFGGALTTYILLLGPVAALLVCLGVSMVKKWQIIKWLTCGVIAAVLLAYAPLWIRATQVLGRRFLPSASGPSTDWLSIFVDFSDRIWHILGPIVAFSLPAAAVLLSVVLDAKGSGFQSRSVNEPPR